MSFQVTVQPAAIREALISERANASTHKEDFYAYQNKLWKLPIIDLPITYPLYRMANFRTRIVQQAFIRRESLASGYFLEGEENEAAQQTQHEFLLKYAKEGRDGSITPILNVLRTEKQRSPLLITSRGIVVNGNRRLAAMRDLYFSNPGQFGDFEHIKVQVLPSTATTDEIKDVEVRLQMKLRTDLDYDWVNECIAVKELRDGKSMKELCALMNKKKGEIEDAINAITEADLYLTEWKGTPFDYESIEDAEQLFYDIGENLSAKSGDAKEISRRIAWLLADKRRDLKRRVYDFKLMFGAKADDVISRLSERFASELDDAAPTEAADDSFDVDLGGGDTEPGNGLRPLISLLENAERREEIAAEVVDVCERILDVGRVKRDGQMALTQIMQINGKFSEIDIGRAAPETLAAIGKQLDSIQLHVTRLKAHVDRART